MDPQGIVSAVDVGVAVLHTDAPPQAPTRQRNRLDANSPPSFDPCRPRTRLGFLQLYGWMGIPMVLIFLLSAAWTLALAIIQDVPTATANYIMGTKNLDKGQFWLLAMPDRGLVVVASLLLVIFAVGYLALVITMLFPDKMLRRYWHQRSHVAPTKPDPRHSLSIPAGWTWKRLRYEVLSPYGVLRQYYNPLLDMPKLVFQTSTLLTYLHHGFPLPVIGIYAGLLVINWMISAYRYKRERPDPHFILCRVFYSFDLFFAVFAPLEVLVYAYYTFHFDYDEFATRVETLGDSAFERTARLYADPQQVSLFRIAFHYLQFTDATSLAIKSALNVLSLFKWWRTIVHLVDANSCPAARASVTSTVERIKRAAIKRRQQIQNMAVAVVFFCAGVGTLVCTVVFVITTRQLCQPLAQCKVLSYRWNVGANACSCIVFVDRETSVKTIAEWESPVDTTATLAALAASGHLEIVQIINRQLPTLPDELRRCHHLKQLILIYTKTLAFPDWAAEFTELEYLHVEGDLTPRQLTYLPPELFYDMAHLMFLHLGCLISLPSIPSLDRLHQLEYLVLAMLHSVSTIPPLTNLHSLKRLNVVDMIQVHALPPTHQLANLRQFALAARNPVCCNGFLTDSCDLANFSCRDRTAQGEPPVHCTASRVAAEDLAQLVATEGTVCSANLAVDLKDTAPTLATADEACGGVKYRQCSLGGLVGVCFPTRMQPVACQVDATYMAMRRLQIQRGVGDACDATVEAWLGCN